jgi:hypothetical protein
MMSGTPPSIRLAVAWPSEASSPASTRTHANNHVFAWRPATCLIGPISASAPILPTFLRSGFRGAHGEHGEHGAVTGCAVVLEVPHTLHVVGGVKYAKYAKYGRPVERRDRCRRPVSTATAPGRTTKPPRSGPGTGSCTVHRALSCKARHVRSVAGRNDASVLWVHSPAHRRWGGLSRCQRMPTIGFRSVDDGRDGKAAQRVGASPSGGRVDDHVG